MHFLYKTQNIENSRILKSARKLLLKTTLRTSFFPKETVLSRPRNREILLYEPADGFL